MIKHFIVPLPNGNYLLKGYWEDGDERLCIQTTEISQEEAEKIADVINQNREATSPGEEERNG